MNKAHLFLFFFGNYLIADLNDSNRQRYMRYTDGNSILAIRIVVLAEDLVGLDHTLFNIAVVAIPFSQCRQSTSVLISIHLFYLLLFF